MPSLWEIETQIKRVNGVGKFLGRWETLELPNILWEDEYIEKIVNGLYGKEFGILIATNKRLIFVYKGLISGLKVEDFPYDKIISIQYEKGMLRGSITIITSGNKAKIDIEKSEVGEFCEYARARINRIEDHASYPITNDKGDLVSQLEKLAKLKEQGILTEEEFLQQKQRILNK